MNRKLALRTFMLISLLVVLVTVPAHTSSQTGTVIAVDPSTTTVAVGQTFFINVNISDVNDLYGWEFKLKWDPTILDVLNVTEGGFLKSGGDTWSRFIMNNTLGCILADCTLLGNITGVNGSGTLAIVEFNVESAGESILDLYDTKLVSSLEQSITHTAKDGYFTSLHDVAITDVIASPTIVLPGQSIQINATVENQGSYTETFNVTAYCNSEAIETQSVSLDSGDYTVLTFAWDTTGVGKGDYTISAEASVVPGETDTADNTKVADSMITVLSQGHDVAIKGVTPSKTVVGEGYSLSIQITAKNYGSFTENFNVTAYYNDTAIILPNGKNYTTITLPSGNSTTFTLMWNTTGVAKGNYAIKATATPLLDETNTTDNTLTDGWVIVAMIGDLTGPTPDVPDGAVDIRDVSLVAKGFGAILITDPTSPKYGEYWHCTPCNMCPHSPNCDLTGPTPGVADEAIDIRDIALVAKNYGKVADT